MQALLKIASNNDTWKNFMPSQGEASGKDQQSGGLLGSLKNIGANRRRKRQEKQTANEVSSSKGQYAGRTITPEEKAKLQAARSAKDPTIAASDNPRDQRKADLHEAFSDDRFKNQDQKKPKLTIGETAKKFGNKALDAGWRNRTGKQKGAIGLAAVATTALGARHMYKKHQQKKEQERQNQYQPPSPGQQQNQQQQQHGSTTGRHAFRPVPGVR